MSLRRLGEEIKNILEGNFGPCCEKMGILKICKVHGKKLCFKLSGLLDYGRQSPVNTGQTLLIIIILPATVWILQYQVGLEMVPKLTP